MDGVLSCSFSSSFHRMDVFEPNEKDVEVIYFLSWVLDNCFESVIANTMSAMMCTKPN
jgi:hypothetical protein